MQPHSGIDVQDESNGLRVFVSYRRDDAADATDRLVDSLHQRFGPEHVFLDVDSIDVAADFEQVIGDWIVRCDVLVAVIGSTWLGVTDEAGKRRLQSPHDFVRLEIEAALDRGVPVVPVLVHGAEVPDPAELPASLSRLARFNALELTRGHWRADVDRLLGALEKLGKQKGRTVPKSRRRLALRPRVLGAGGALAVAAALIAVAVAISGGGGAASRGSTAQVQDSLAQQHAREVATVLDNCGPQCSPTAVAGLGVPIGRGRGYVRGLLGGQLDHVHRHLALICRT